MPFSYHCKQCDDFYPRKPEYSVCPSCEADCKKSNEEPDIPGELAEYRFLWRKRVKAFEEWCEENNRTDGDPRSIVVEVPDKNDRPAVDYAFRVCDMINRSLPHYDLGTLFVFGDRHEV